MIKITIKKYMVIDLAMLIGLGIIVEALAMYVIPNVLYNAASFFCVSLLICIVAVERWSWKGFVAMPIMAIAATVSGRIVAEVSSAESIHELAKYYNWRVLLTNLITNTSAFLMIPFKMVVKKKKVRPTRFVVEGITALVLATGCVLQVLCYCLVTLAFKASNIAVLIIYDLPAILVTLLFMAVLRHQGIFVDAKQDLIDKKEEAEIEQKYYSNLRKNVIDRPGEEDNSSKK